MGISRENPFMQNLLYCTILMLISSITRCSVALLMQISPDEVFRRQLENGCSASETETSFWAGGGVQHYSFFWGGAGCIYHSWDGLHYSFCTMNDALSILPCCQCSIAIGETIRLVEFTCKGLWSKSLVSLPTKPKYKLSLNALCIQDDGPNRHLC